jgi:heme-degrading monooxygenase HmoA
MTRSLLYLRTKPNRRDELLQVFERLGVLALASQQPGFLGAELQVPLDDGDEVLVTAAWASPEHYEAWLASPVREAMGDELMPLLEAEPERRVYRVVETIS